MSVSISRSYLFFTESHFRAGLDLIISFADHLIAFLQPTGNLDSVSQLSPRGHGYLYGAILFDLKDHLSAVTRRHRRSRYGQYRFHVGGVGAGTGGEESNFRAH